MFEEKKGGTNKLFLWFCFGDRVSIGLGRTSRSMGICSVELIGRWESVLCFCQKNVEGEGGNKQTLFCGSCFRDRFSIGFAGRTSRLMRILFWFAVFAHKRTNVILVNTYGYGLMPCNTRVLLASLAHYIFQRMQIQSCSRRFV